MGISSFDDDAIGIEAKQTLFRIYRDTRFSKDKTPYKTHFGANLTGKKNAGSFSGYLLQLEPGNTFLAGGTCAPDSTRILGIRQTISENRDEFKKVLKQKSFKANFKNVEGEKLKNPPRGFTVEDPMLEYLKLKEHLIKHHVSDEQVTSADFRQYCVKIFKTMVPFNNFMNASLHTAATV